MKCDGYNRDFHEVDCLHARGLCNSCYHKKWREENKEAIIKYQKEYRSDPSYDELNRLYTQEYRRKLNENKNS